MNLVWIKRSLRVFSFQRRRKLLCLSTLIVYGDLFSTKNVHFIKKKMQLCVCFLEMFCPLKGWYVLL